MTNSPYIFTSERLGFRQWRTDDLEEFAKLNADEAVMEHFPSTLSESEVVEFIVKLKEHYETNGFTYYATEILETNEFIGMIGLASQKYVTDYTPAIDIGWRLKQSAWGKGYATEGAKRCLEYAFNDLGIEKVISVCVTQNFKSEKVMKKIGMTKIGSFDHPEMKDNPGYERHHCYEIVNGE